MKPLLHSPVITSLLGYAIWAWMALVSRTVRWTIEGDETARAGWARHAGGIVVACWHETILLMPAGWARWIKFWPGRKGRAAMMISLSPDGEPVAKAVRHLDLDVVRGSAGNRRKADKDKGGVRAIAEASRRLKTGGAICLTPDGPRGPRRQVSPGAITIAQRSGAAILPYALSARPVRRLDSWDRFIIPFPFTRGAIVFGAVLDCPREADPEMLRAELQRRMDWATARAEEITGAAASVRAGAAV